MPKTLTKDSKEIQYLCSKDKRLAKMISMVGDITYDLHGDSFVFFIQEIIEQMMSTKVARVLYQRLVDKCGGGPTPEQILEMPLEDIRTIGVSRRKAETMKGVADAIISGRLDLDHISEMSDEEIIRELVSIKGIGEWTAHMYLIFVLDRPDVLAYGDGAFLQVYSWMYKTDDISKKSVQKKCKKWSPYVSTAVRIFLSCIRYGTNQRTISFI